MRKNGFFQKWQEERIIRTLTEALAYSYEQDADHYQELYYACLHQEEIERYPWLE
jgi:hypothetical protein